MFFPGFFVFVFVCLFVVLFCFCFGRPGSCCSSFQFYMLVFWGVLSVFICLCTCMTLCIMWPVSLDCPLSNLYYLILVWLFCYQLVLLSACSIILTCLYHYSYTVYRMVLLSACSIILTCLYNYSYTVYRMVLLSAYSIILTCLYHYSYTVYRMVLLSACSIILTCLYHYSCTVYRMVLLSACSIILTCLYHFSYICIRRIQSVTQLDKIFLTYIQIYVFPTSVNENSSVTFLPLTCSILTTCFCNYIHVHCNLIGWDDEMMQE
jgi:hypothetical protein